MPGMNEHGIGCLRRPTAPALAISLLLHAAAVQWLRPPRQWMPDAPEPTMSVFLLPPPRALATPKAVLPPQPPTPARAPERPIASQPRVPAVGVAVPPAVAGGPGPPAGDSRRAAAVASPGPGAAAGDFYERARETVRRMVAEEPTAASNGAPTGFDAPRLPALAEALAAPRAAESTTAGGRRRVVTRSGSEYCLAPRPDVPSGGLVPRLAVPTTCP